MYTLRCLFTVVVLCVAVTAGCRSKTPGNAAPAPHPTEKNTKESDDPFAEKSQTTPAIEATAAKEQVAGQSTETHEPDNAATPEIVADPKPEQASADLSTPAEPAGQAMAQTGSWTTHRLVLMGKGGPRFLKLDISVDGVDLAKGFESQVAEVAKQLSLDFEHPIQWNALLDKPIIASGWLGNLVPAPEQRDQLRNMYDVNKNDLVEEGEFAAFLTRGLTRIAHVKLNSRPSTAPRLPSDSAWGPIDRDEDGELAPHEVEHTTETMLRYDFDGDHILTAAELRTSSDPGQAMSTRPLLMDETPVYTWSLEKTESVAEQIVRHYSFSDALSAETLFSWPTDRIKRLDSDQDLSIMEPELRSLSDEDLDGTFKLRFTDQTKQNSEKSSVTFQTIGQNAADRWRDHLAGGRLTFDGCIITILLNDEQDESTRQSFGEQFKRIEQDPQLRGFAMQALELKEGAMETLQEACEKEKLEAGQLAWNWLVGPRHWHMQVGWSVSDSPWFELIDLNGDQRLVVAELDQFAAQTKGWDRNKDGSISLEEMPISVLLEVRRPEARGLRSRLGGTGVEKRGANAASAPTWFMGMDYNSDGELSRSEFLGDQSDFDKLDLDRDGIIKAREVTTPQ